MNQLEEGTALHLDFAKLVKSLGKEPNIMPVAVQNINTKEVILVAYVNERALKAAVKTRTAVFWSTSRNELWKKGKTSGEIFDLIEIYVNCEQNSLLYKVRPKRGGICHTKNQKGEARNCFYRRLDLDTLEMENIDP
jgi:phosphoribosyl-AMP cyclohydrolase